MPAQVRDSSCLVPHRTSLARNRCVLFAERTGKQEVQYSLDRNSLYDQGQIAKLFMRGRSQVVRLPAAFQFDNKEVLIRKDPATGDVILSRRPDNWDGFFAALNGIDVPDDFLSKEERQQDGPERDPFEGWRE